MLNILVISDEAKSIASLFRTAGYAPATESPQPPPAGSEEADQQHYDIAFLDADAGHWRDRLLDARHTMPVVVFSRPDLRTAVEALKLGASDYLEKPLTAEVVNEVIDRFRKKILSHKYGFDELIGNSAVMQEVFGLIKKAAASESNVLITGESGTGKELIARAIHRWSPRSERSFMTINCTAIPDTLLESELFGFEKGAFTGAQYTKKGLLEQADGGTVFFDEIGDVSPLFQTKILRVLQEGEIMRIGGMRHQRVDLRFIAATNRDLKTACQRGAFREDLFYRLNVINIHLPPLRDRLEDILFLAKHFVQKHAPKRRDVLIKCISGEALSLLQEHSYPGNVRELENIIEHAVAVTTKNILTDEDFPQQLKSSVPVDSEEAELFEKTAPGGADAFFGKGLSLDVELETHEKCILLGALKRANGVQKKAAQILGINYRSLRHRLEKYDLLNSKGSNFAESSGDSE
jgi:DNA-binding NtrC family response regulator